MIKQNIRIIIILAIVAAMLLYCWTIIISSETVAIWKHYLGLLFFIGIVVSFLKNPKVTIVAMGAYLLLASLNVIALTPSIMTE